MKVGATVIAQVDPEELGRKSTKVTAAPHLHSPPTPGGQPCDPLLPGAHREGLRPLAPAMLVGSSKQLGEMVWLTCNLIKVRRLPVMVQRWRESSRAPQTTASPGHLPVLLSDSIQLHMRP